jgi:alanine-glyoxylate transaminase/serine-glyoxylate transaminase/serine-pyruvate transaminase
MRSNKGRKLLMIPGPIEFEPDVLAAMAEPTPSHVAPDFIEVFGHALDQLRDVFVAPDGQPFVVAGSGTLAMELAVANLLEPGDAVLVVNTGYFSDRMAAICARSGAQVTHVRADHVGGAPSQDAVAQALQAGTYKVMTITHVDTSTGVLTDVAGLARPAQSAGVLTVVDGVCSVAGEALQMTDWGVDVALTASQKAIGVPPGLALVMARPRAIETFRQRQAPVSSFYADWSNWLPIMEAYQARRAAYFGTPAVNLVLALDVATSHIVAEGLDRRVARHHRMSRAIKAGLTALGFNQVPTAPELAAHTLTAAYFPEGVDGPTLLAKTTGAGVILAGGLHPEIRTRYFRIGHMGAVNAADVLATVGAIEQGLSGAGYRFEVGVGLAAAQKALLA